MHELSIATSILKTAEQETKKAGGKSIEKIVLEIGKISGADIDSLRFVWDLCMKGSVLENSNLIINEPLGKAQCAECGEIFELKKIFDSCHNCGSNFKKIISGKELKIKQLTIEI